MTQTTWRQPPGARPRLDDRSAGGTPGVSGKADAEARLDSNRRRLGEWQYRLWAERRQSLLVVLQGMDTSGKDGVVRHVMTGMNPSGCRVTSFKKPTEEETERDFLWRIHRAVPSRGEIGVFNRSHYEDVLVARVRSLVPSAVWRPRFDRINEFERLLVEGGTTIVKCFLHVSKAEQKRRLVSRLEDPEKNWKFNAGDVEERRRWPRYMAAYRDAIERCGTPRAPWHVIPSDQKWYRNWAVSEVLVKTLERMAPRTPKGTLRVSDFFVDDTFSGTA